MRVERQGPLTDGDIAHVREHHPGATMPGLFADEKLFDDARQVFDELGEEAVFAPMNEGGEGDAEWGAFGGRKKAP